jgi:hypothetical protein
MQNRLIFSSVPKLIKSNQFLPIDAKIEKHFAGYDSKELFEKNLKIMPEDWYYRNNIVNYTRNKQGYRTKNFKEIDWANSLVMFGCSNVFGIGVDNTNTIAVHLSNLLKVPVVNLGVEGSSINYSLHNATILRHSYPMPLGVINLWTHYSRTVYYNKRYLENCGDWNKSHHYFSAWSNDDSHSESYALIASKTSNIYWEKIKHYEASLFPDTGRLLNCDIYIPTDFARDLVHPGINSNKMIAEKIANKINL